uniref:Uncharacterized protein n=1 Tax=viral metagenome TaxID=1070528 RepID=A0A6C0IGG1_9ZZZZ
MGNNINSGKNKKIIDMTKPGMTIAREMANLVYNELPNKYKNQKYKNKIYEIIREKLGPNENFKIFKESLNDLDLKPGDGQVNWDKIKEKNPYIFLYEVKQQLYEDNTEL